VFDRKQSKRQVHCEGTTARGPGPPLENVSERDRAAAAAARGEKVLLVRNETSPRIWRGMIAAEGILQQRAASVRTAALVARQMAKVWSAAQPRSRIDYAAKTMTVDGVTYKEGDLPFDQWNAGESLSGQIPTRRPDRPSAY